VKFAVRKAASKQDITAIQRLNRPLVCDSFNRVPTLHRFRVVTTYWSKVLLSTGRSPIIDFTAAICNNCSTDMQNILEEQNLYCWTRLTLSKVKEGPRYLLYESKAPYNLESGRHRSFVGKKTKPVCMLRRQTATATALHVDYCTHVRLSQPASAWLCRHCTVTALLAAYFPGGGDDKSTSEPRGTDWLPAAALP